MKKLLTLLFCVGASALCLSANSDVRMWTPQDGEKFSAELVSYDLDSDELVLKLDNSEDRIFRGADFSIIDQAWIVEWYEFDKDLNEIMARAGGQVEHRVYPGEMEIDMYIYRPSRKWEQDSGWPVMYLFHPAGKAARYLKRHIDAAEATGMMVIALAPYRNRMDTEWERRANAQLRRVHDYVLEDLDVNPDKIFLGGISGGAMRAFGITHWFEFPWAGVYSNGGWLGGPKNHDKPYASGMRVAMVNGVLDHAANRVLERVSDVMIKRGNEVGVFSFEGGHQVPPTRTQEKVFAWLLGAIDAAE